MTHEPSDASVALLPCPWCRKLPRPISDLVVGCRTPNCPLYEVDLEEEEWNRREIEASRDGGALPELPEPLRWQCQCCGNDQNGYDADQLIAYGEACRRAPYSIFIRAFAAIAQMRQPEGAKVKWPNELIDRDQVISILSKCKTDMESLPPHGERR